VYSLTERFRLLRELGSRPVATWAAIELQPNGRTRLAVVGRVARQAYAERDLADWIRTAEQLAKVMHPNLSRVRDVVRRADEVLVAGEFIDGVTWAKLTASPRPPPLEMALRVFIDVLSGLGALHTLRHSGTPLNLIHGALSPDCIVVGTDGVGRLLNTCPLRSAVYRPGRSSAYLAPEVLLEDDSADPRADVYSVGAMLWEALSGEPLFPNLQASAIVTQLLSGRPGRPSVRVASAWAGPLADVASRAMSADPQKRFASAATFAAEIRRTAGLKLMPPARVAAWMQEVHGDAVRLLREALERGGARPLEASRIAPQPATEDEEASIDIIVDRPSTAPTPMLPAAPASIGDPHESQVQRVATRRPPPDERANLTEPVNIDPTVDSAPAIDSALRDIDRVRVPSPFERLSLPQAPLVPKGLEHALPPPRIEPKPPPRLESPPPLSVRVRESPVASSPPSVSEATGRGLMPRRTLFTLALAVVGALLVLLLWLSSSDGNPRAPSNTSSGLVSSAPLAALGGSSAEPSGPASSVAAVRELPVVPPASATPTAEGPSRAIGPVPARSVRGRTSSAKKYEPEGI
jgi:hypothetical protein